MKAELIKGKKGRSKRDRIQLGWYNYGISRQDLFNEVINTLDAPDEPDEPDMVQVTMTLEDAQYLAQYYWSPTGPNHRLSESIRNILKEQNID